MPEINVIFMIITTYYIPL